MSENEEFIPRSAMVVVAHPDDAEFMVAGTVARWAARGAEVTYVIITNGNKGSDDPEMTPSKLAEIREKEQRAAGRILGVKNFEFLGYEDGYLEPTLDVRRDITRVIRKYKPQVVMTFDPDIRFYGGSYPNHPDHRAAGSATIDAIFPSARDRLTFPELLADGLEPHKVEQLWMAAADEANAVVDITDTLELKKKALLAHPSQLGEDITEFVIERGKSSAKGHPFEYGEAFRRIVLDGPLPGTEED